MSVYLFCACCFDSIELRNNKVSKSNATAYLIQIYVIQTRILFYRPSLNDYNLFLKKKSKKSYKLICFHEVLYGHDEKLPDIG